MKYKLLGVATVVSLIQSCGVSNSPKTQTLNGTALNGRLTVMSQSLVSAPSFSLTLVGRLNPPVLSGMKGQSTAIDLQTGKAYVSFNVKGPTHQKGAVTVVNTGSTPSLDKEVQFLDQDVNYVQFKDSKFNIVGAKQNNNDGNAYFQQFTLNSSGVPSFVFDKVVPSFAANHVKVDSNYYYVSSGDVNGGLSVFKRTDNSLKFATTIQDSRSIGLNACGKEVSVLTGQNSNIIKYSMNKINTMTTAPGMSYNYGGNTEQEARSEIISGVDYSIISLGDQGFKVVCNADMAVKAVVPVPVRSDVATADIRTNGVAAQKGLIFAAQGGAGLYVYAFKKVGAVPTTGCQNVTVSELGHTTITLGDSVNSVQALGSQVATTNGNGGVELLTYSNVAGTDDVDDFDPAYQTTTCDTRKLLEGCDSMTELSEDANHIVNVPASQNDKECFSLKIVNYQSNKNSTSYTTRYASLISKDHDTGSNASPRIMSQTNYKILLNGARDAYVSGSKTGLTSFYVDNFLFLKLTNGTSIQRFGTGTGDSAAIGYTAPILTATTSMIPFLVKAPSGVAQHSTALQLTNSYLTFPVGVQFDLDSLALDAGVLGQTSDMYLIFK